MSDSAQTLVPIDLPAAEAPATADRLRHDLIVRDIIDVRTGDTVLGSSTGHRPGPNAERALAERPSHPHHDFRSLDINGVAFILGRCVFDTGGNGIVLRCNRCQAAIIDDPGYIDAAAAWAAGRDDASYACPTCREAQPVYRWDGPFAFGLGHLGVRFFNWPPLDGIFLRTVVSVLGREVRIVKQQL